MLRLPRRQVTTAVLMILCAPAVTAWADAPAGEVTTAHARPHDDDGDRPRLKLSYRHFAITNLDGSQIPLDGAQLDAYLVSRRWLRIGLVLEGGGGSGSYSGYQANLDYGLVGLAAGVQIPGPITPFVEGRVIGGFLAGQVTGTPAAASGSGFMLTMEERHDLHLWRRRRRRDGDLLDRAQLCLALGRLGLDHVARHRSARDDRRHHRRDPLQGHRRQQA